jgi:hypothetical protein
METPGKPAATRRAAAIQIRRARRQGGAARAENLLAFGRKNHISH